VEIALLTYGCQKNSNVIKLGEIMPNFVGSFLQQNRSIFHFKKLLMIALLKRDNEGAAGK